MAVRDIGLDDALAAVVAETLADPEVKCRALEDLIAECAEE